MDQIDKTGKEVSPMIDDFFEDGLDLEDYAWIGGLFGFVEDEEAKERRRKKLERELNPDDADWEDLKDDEEDYV